MRLFSLVVFIDSADANNPRSALSEVSVVSTRDEAFDTIFKFIREDLLIHRTEDLLAFLEKSPLFDMDLERWIAGGSAGPIEYINNATATQKEALIEWYFAELRSEKRNSFYRIKQHIVDGNTSHKQKSSAHSQDLDDHTRLTLEQCSNLYEFCCTVLDGGSTEASFMADGEFIVDVLKDIDFECIYPEFRFSKINEILCYARESNSWDETYVRSWPRIVKDNLAEIRGRNYCTKNGEVWEIKCITPVGNDILHGAVSQDYLAYGILDMLNNQVAFD